MAWSVLQSKSNGAASASSVAVTFTTANVSAGTKLIAWVIADFSSGPTINSVKDGAGNSFTLVPGGSASGNNSGVFVLFSCYTLDTPAGDVGTKPTITATMSGTVSDVSMLVQEVSGLAPGDAHDGTPGTAFAVAAASIAQPAYTSASASEYLTTAFGDDGNSQTVTVPTGYTPDTSNVSGSGTNNIAVGYKNSTGGAESGTWTFGSASGRDAFVVVAFKLAPPGNDPSAAMPGPAWLNQFGMAWG